MAKGQAQFIEHILTVLFSVLVVVGISALVYSFYYTSLQRESTTELRQVVTQTSDTLLKLYEIGKKSSVSPDTNKSILISSIDLTLPKQIGGENYELSLIGKRGVWSSIINMTIGGVTIIPTERTGGIKIIGRMIDSKVEVEFDIPNLEIEVQGMTNGENATMKYYRVNDNGTIFDSVVLGDSGVIIRIFGIS